jgi:hypothetical protein
MTMSKLGSLSLSALFGAAALAVSMAPAQAFTGSALSGESSAVSAPIEKAYYYRGGYYPYHNGGRYYHHRRHYYHGGHRYYRYY